MNPYQGWCEQGGNTVSTIGFSSSTKVQRSFPNATVTVYLTGTTTLATVYSDSAGAVVQANPFTADSRSSWRFYGALSVYDLRFSGAGISSPFTRTYTSGIGGSPSSGAVAEWTHANVYIDAVAGNDANDGLTAVTAFATHNAFFRLTRGAVINPPINAAATGGRTLKIHILSSLPATDPINLDCILALDALIQYVGGVATIVATGSFTTVVDKDPTTNAAFELTDTALVGTWAAHIGKRVRITSGARIDTIMWVAKDLGATTFRPSDPSIAAEYDATTVATFGESSPWIPNVFPRTPQIGDAYAIEDLFTVTMGSITVRAMGPGTAAWLPGLTFSALEIAPVGTFAPEMPIGIVILTSVKCGRIFLVKLIEEAYLQNCHFPAGCFSESGGLLAQLMGGLVGCAAGSYGVFGAGGRLHLNNDVMIHGASVRGSGVCIQSACVFDAADSLSSSGHGVDVGRMQVTTTVAFGLAGAMTLGRTQTTHHDNNIRLWGAGNARAGVNVQPGSTFSAQSVFPTITGAGGDFSVAGVSSARAWDESTGAYTTSRTATWAHLAGTVASGGFAGNAHNVAAAAHVIAV